MKRLLLFDIDGTIMRVATNMPPIDIGGIAMIRALSKVYGERKYTRSGVYLGGRCDPDIAAEVASAAGVPRPVFFEGINQFVPEYATALREGIDASPKNYVIPCPAIHELLGFLSSRAELALLTGNFSEIAPIKLEAVGVSPDLFKFGSYGSDSLDRNDLPGIALTRAEVLYGKPVSKQNVLIVGDTKEDVLCAKSNGIRSAAVATGCTSLEHLQELKPDLSFPDFTDYETVAKAMLD